MKARYQVPLEPEHRRRLERLARQQQRPIASVLRQALDIGLAALEADPAELWTQRRAILTRARARLAGLPPIQENLVEAAHDERDADRD